MAVSFVVVDGRLRPNARVQVATVSASEQALTCNAMLGLVLFDGLILKVILLRLSEQKRLLKLRWSWFQMPSPSESFQTPAYSIWAGKQCCSIQTYVVEPSKNGRLCITVYFNHKAIIFILEEITNLLPVI